MPGIAIETYEKVDQKERLKEITDKLEQGIMDLFAGEKFKEYLNTMSRFHNYSFNNTMLIAMQKPNATYVAGYKTWKNKFERQVSTGEKGIQIFAPAPFKVKKEMEKIDKNTGLPALDKRGNPIIEEVEVTIPYFKVVPVFDVSQTYGKELPTLADELNGGVTEYERLFEALKSVSPAPIEFKPISDGSKGYYHFGDKSIVINEDMSQLQTVKTAIHEIAHAKLHDRDLVKADLTEAKDKQTMEVEAEAIAYTVCQHYGIDTSDYSFGYIAAWGSNKEMPELKKSLETIRATSSEIINKIDEQMRDFDKDLAQAQNKAMPTPEKSEKSKPDKSDIIGNTAYKDIADKKYFKIDSQAVGKITTALEFLDVKFSGRVNGDTTTFTVSAADVDKFREAEKAANAHKIPPAEHGEQSAPKAEKPDKKDIIGNTKYNDISDKKYMKMDTVIAVKVADELEKQGVKFSGRIAGDKTTLTIGSADVDLCKKIAKEVRAAEAELKVADKMPEPPVPNMPEADYRFDIYQLSEIPENRGFRFAPLEELQALSLDVDSEKYDFVYSAAIIADGRTKDEILEDIFKQFNIAHPEDFKGHSLSVSDVVVLDNGNERTAHYCDSAGFAELSHFGNIVLAEQEKPHPPVYMQSLSYAVQNGEHDAFHESRRINQECAEAIDKAILSVAVNKGMPGAYTYDLPKALAEVTDKYGIERINSVVSNFVNRHEWDRRWSNENIKWANGIEIAQVYPATFDTHIAVLDGFVNHVRKENIINEILAEIQNGEPEDYGGREGLTEIVKNLREKPVWKLENELKEMEQQAMSDFAEHLSEMAEHSERLSDKPPTLSELQTAVDKGETISLMDLAKAVKEEKNAPKSKKSIKGRIQADKETKRNQTPAERTEPTAKKIKGEAEL